MGIPQDREQWSESSKRSYIYYYADTTYEDIKYCCSKCGTEAIFPADKQKYAYEVKKQYIWKRRTLCGMCNNELYHLKMMEKGFQERWSKDKTILKNDQKFLMEWLAALKAIPMYKQRECNSIKNMLEKLLKTLV
jgi:hypothetical protein